jgi:hypothetical protein
MRSILVWADGGDFLWIVEARVRQFRGGPAPWFERHSSTWDDNEWALVERLREQGKLRLAA